MIKYTLFLTFFIFLTSCERSDKELTSPFIGQAMTMQYRVLIGKPVDRKEGREIRRIISDTFDEIDAIYNKWNPNSEVSQLNNSKAGQKISISKKLELFLTQTHRLVTLSDGKFDPTIEAAQKAWKDCFKKNIAPREEEVHKLSEAVGWDKIHIADGLFWKDHDMLELDLGGVAKGYAIDLVLERLNDAGYPDVYVEWGGEIRTSGRHPEDRPWRIFVSNKGSIDPSAALAIVDMNNNAVASSGDYLQNWTVEGKTYFHIIDPQTLHPLVATSHTICCATIIAENCMTADALATAVMLFNSPSEAEAWLEGLKKEMPELQYWIEARSNP